VFSWPCFLMGESGEIPLLCMMLLSTLGGAAEKYESSAGCTLLLLGDKGLPLLWGLPSLTGLSRTLVFNFRALSKEVGSS
jgi:hypothetical protein